MSNITVAQLRTTFLDADLFYKGNAANTGAEETDQSITGANLAAQIFARLAAYEAVATSTTIVKSNGKRVNQTASGIVSTVWATPVAGDTVIFKNSSSGANTINGNGDDIDGSSSPFALNAGESIEMCSTGTEWIIY